jgi:hypothetical protein
MANPVHDARLRFGALLSPAAAHISALNARQLRERKHIRGKNKLHEGIKALK